MFVKKDYQRELTPEDNSIMFELEWDFDDDVSESSSQSSVKIAVPRSVSKAWKTSFENKGKIRDHHKQELLDELAMLYIRKQSGDQLLNVCSDSPTPAKLDGDSLGQDLHRSIYKQKKMSKSQNYSKNKIETFLGNIGLNLAQTKWASPEKRKTSFQVTKDIQFLLRHMANKNQKKLAPVDDVTVNDIEPAT